MPLANAFLQPEEVDRDEPRYPLTVLRCGACGLAQLTVVVDPKLLFSEYPYQSSASIPMRAHFVDLAAELVSRFAPPGSLVVEVGSNDGVLLEPLIGRGARAVGVEPARNLAALANARGLETWNEFFGTEVAVRLARERGPAAIVVANNVLAHIDDLGDVLRSLDTLLAHDGVLVAEVPYLGDLIDRVEYDTIYHEHLSYFALAPLARLFGQARMELFDIRRLDVHGGSIRIYVARAGTRSSSQRLREAEEAERRAGLADPTVYARFAERVGASRTALRTLVAELRGAGKRVAALGASAKGNTLLNYCGFGPTEVAYVADSTPLKQGRLTPGTRIPVRPESAIREDRPHYTLLLAWNYADTILARFEDYIASGGRFIHPVPIARVIPP